MYGGLEGFVGGWKGVWKLVRGWKGVGGGVGGVCRGLKRLEVGGVCGRLEECVGGWRGL